ncbi:MAG: hypothetical protein VKJ27_01730 [Synechocystis sp.]|nr:hypothetical protein [Synechocystis sp.]
MFSKFTNQPNRDDGQELAAALDLKEQDAENIDLEACNTEDSTLSLGQPAMNKIDNNPESVQVVEKISNIVSPYFIVIVGLLLYENNFLIGTTLIFIGIFSLLKLSWQDLQRLINQVLSFFQEKQ